MRIKGYLDLFLSSEHYETLSRLSVHLALITVAWVIFDRVFYSWPVNGRQSNTAVLNKDDGAALGV
jgi:hypothetical protein